MIDLHHLNKEDNGGLQNSLPTSVLLARPRAACRSKRVTLFAIFAGLVIIIRMFMPYYTSYAYQRTRENRKPNRLESTTSQTKPIVVLPATQSNPEFCRTLFSLLINGYDPPVIINWKDRTNTRHYKKIGGMLTWLEDRAGNSTDVVVMLDGYDAWAQLPGDLVFEQHRNYPFQSSSSVIVGAEKNCWPPVHERCASLPESPLPLDVYGSRTDKDNEMIPLDVHPAKSKHTNHRYGRLETRRPRYLNSGTLIGTSHALKDLFSRMSVKLKLVADKRLVVKIMGSDQEVMGIVNDEDIQAKRPHAVVPDGHQLLFQVVTFSIKDLILQTLKKSVSDTNAHQANLLTTFMDKNKQWTNRSLVYNHISHTVPAFLHFPGPKKHVTTDVWWKLMWWMQPTPETGNPSIQDVNEHPTGKLPAEIFYDKMALDTSEESGYGARLPDGTWFSYMDMCRPYFSAILG